ncbi:MAG TPA: helix-turn-helix domain-containing protein [Candidatus Nanoarchaeia archaeon]|nr:helix-turn-helix domain-containing protein [Candidatus Nanoarchaeia archaeon]
MEDEDLIKILKELNLSEKESSVYLSLLELGQSNVTRLANKANINRVTTYHILRSLISKGLVSSIEKDNIQNFMAIEPKRLIEALKEKEEKIKSILPELEAKMQTIGSKPSVSLFEGKKGISTLLDNIINDAKGEILVYGNYKIAEKAIEYESLHYRKTRIFKKIKQKGIVNSFEGIDFIKNREWKKLTEIKSLKHLENISTWVEIYDTKVVILTFKKELIGILIDNVEIADMHKLFFDIMWKIAKY